MRCRLAGDKTIQCQKVAFGFQFAGNIALVACEDHQLKNYEVIPINKWQRAVAKQKDHSLLGRVDE